MRDGLRGIGLIALAAAAPLRGSRAQEPQMATIVRGIAISLDECKARVLSALKSEGYLEFLSFGNGWIAHARGTAASVGCIPSGQETVVMMVAAGGRMVTELKRLLDRIQDSARAVPAEQARPPGSAKSGWTVTANDLGSAAGARFTLWCPPNGSAGPVWGSDPYASESSICTAAVHAGTISFGTGGNAIIELRGGLSSFVASTRNGVTTQSADSPRGSFMIVGRKP